MENKSLIREIGFNGDLEFKKDGSNIVVKGERGTVEKKLAYPGIEFKTEGKKIIVSTKKGSKNSKRLVGTFCAHIKNLIKGVTEGYSYKLKICSGHFPMKVTIEGSEVVISNFLGEKIPRKAKILNNVKVQLDGDVISVESTDKEKAGQTVANMERATRVTNRDRRVFQDGIYLLKK